MRAMVLLVLLLALIAFVSFRESLVPYWQARLPAVMSCLDEGRFGDALDAAMAADPPGAKRVGRAKSEPLGEDAPHMPPGSLPARAPAADAPTGGDAPSGGAGPAVADDSLSAGTPGADTS